MWEWKLTWTVGYFVQETLRYHTRNTKAEELSSSPKHDDNVPAIFTNKELVVLWVF